jgi:hypothetical protein
MASPATPAPAAAADPSNPSTFSMGQPEGQEQSIHHSANAKVPWPPAIWEAIHKAVHEEVSRVEIAHRFMRVHSVHPKTTSVPPDLISPLQLPGDPTGNLTLTVDEGVTIRLNEIWTEFALTPQQVHDTAESKHPEHCTAVTLARRSAQYLGLAKNMVVMQGQNAYTTQYFSQYIRYRAGQVPLDMGLLGAGPGTPYSAPTNPPPGVPGPEGETLPVEPISVTEIPGATSSFGVTWGQNTFAQIANGYTILDDLGHPGEYAFVVGTDPYADLFAPVGAGSLVITADRVTPLVKAGLISTGALPPYTGVPPTSPPAGSPPAGPYYGVLVDPVGDNMDVIVGLHAITVFMQQDNNDNWRFRVLTRFALRLKDPTAVVVLQFN